MEIIKKGDYRVPVFSWCADIEDSAMVQIDNLARLPFVKPYVAIMPDCHAGYGMPIGGVIACEDAVIPNAVGKDIGCGALAVKTNLEHITGDALRVILAGIRDRVPVGFEWHKTPVVEPWLPWKDLPVVASQLDKARLQLGTLGSGNHFIEIQKDETGLYWFMIHSGSRNLGKVVADHYNKVARALNAKFYSSVPDDWGLAFLPRGHPAYDLYMTEMGYCVDFAADNRLTIARLVKEAFIVVFDDCVEFLHSIDIAHNYAAIEQVGERGLVVHRKGATSARTGEVGIIPGSQGTASYIVEGLGNPKSFHSCSHGAGRKMGRKEAQRSLDLATEVARLDELGVVHGIRTIGDLDEAPGAYKDIDAVMAAQADLVRIVHKLTPLAVIKG